MPKKKALTIELYGSPKNIRFRFIARNGAKYGHKYDETRYAKRSLERITTAISDGDYEIVDNTKPRKGPRVARRS